MTKLGLHKERTQKLKNIYLDPIIRETANKEHTEITFHKYYWKTF